eukprot:6482746-Amphidinium_carterae.2
MARYIAGTTRLRADDHYDRPFEEVGLDEDGVTTHVLVNTHDLAAMLCTFEATAAAEELNPELMPAPSLDERARLPVGGG